MSEMPPPSVPPSYPPPPGGGSSAPPAPPSSDRNIMLFLSYFGIFALIPLLTKKDDSEIQWHSKNGLALTVAYVIAWVVVFALSFALPGVLKLLGSVLGCVVFLGYVIVDIMAMLKAFKGQRMRIPVTSDFADKM